MRFVILNFLILSLNQMHLRAETLNNWILSRVQADEQLWIKSIRGIDGHELALLEHSKYYVPFFMELPDVGSSLIEHDATRFRDWKKQKDEDLLPGGYIYRMKFETAPPLYAMSAGFFEIYKWHSLSLVNDLEIEDSQVWESPKRDCLYTTLLAGPRPRLINYNRSGEVAHQETFNASDNDFEQQLQAALAPYSSSEKPVLEMISLAEYLQQPNAIWRLLDVSGQFNLRNQDQRPDEQELLKQIRHLTRSAAVSALMIDTATTNQPKPTLRPPPFVRLPPKQSAETKLSPTGSEQPTSSTPWSLIVVSMAAATGLAWVLLKKRK